MPPVRKLRAWKRSWPACLPWLRDRCVFPRCCLLPAKSTPSTAHASAQAEKLQFGKTRSIVSFVEGLVLVQSALYPVVMALVGDEEANVGLMMGALGQLQELFSGLQRKAEVYETQEAVE